MGDWRDDAECVNVDPEAFFPVVKNSEKEAARICEQDCIVAEECLAYAFKTRQRHGIWGGMVLFDQRMTKGGYRAQLKRLQELHG